MLLIRIVCDDMSSSDGWSGDWEYNLDLSTVEVVGWLLHVDDRLVRVAGALQDPEDVEHRDIGAVTAIPRSTIREVHTLAISDEYDLEEFTCP